MDESISSKAVPLFSRRSIGIELHISNEYDDLIDPQSLSHSILYEDGFFRVSASSLIYVKQLLSQGRSRASAEIATGRTVSVLVPERDPPILRVTRTEKRQSFFNLGELQRPRFLANVPSYPFKRHQQFGVDWLVKNRRCILADDMGLGKTLQAIAAFEELHRNDLARNTLVLCPKSLIGNWEAEVSLWAPHLCTVGLHTKIENQAWKQASQQSHIVITNYENLRNSTIDPDSFDVVIFDEIHRLKNSRSAIHKAASKLEPEFAWGLTGTPLENSSEELIAILQLIDRKRISLSDRTLPLASIRSLASKYLLRRQKGVISDELPEVSEKVENILLTPAQRAAYAAELSKSRSDAEREWVATFNRLRDICDFDPVTKESAKINRALTIIDAIAKLQQKVVIFSYRLEPLALIQSRLVDQFGNSSLRIITGSTDSQERSNIVKSFQSVTGPFVLLCSMRATAEGLTLTQANHVIFLNEWWNPALNRQARDRVNRIGQTRDVSVYRLRAVGTIESRLAEILERKSQLFDEVVERLAIVIKNPSSGRVHPLLRSVLDTADPAVKK